jgi:hypothetical protein
MDSPNSPESRLDVSQSPATDIPIAVDLVVLCHRIVIVAACFAALALSLPLRSCIAVVCMIGFAGSVYLVQQRPAGAYLVASFDCCLLAAGITMLSYSIHRALQPLPELLYNTDDGPYVEAMFRRIALGMSAAVIALAAVLLASLVKWGSRSMRKQ